jgi:tetratricopeptide (TPR) repeat protein
MSGGSDRVLAFDRTRRERAAARAAEFAQTARRLQRERANGADVLARHLDATPRGEWGRLAEVPELRTSGVLEQLARRVGDRREIDPQEALALSTLATTIAETLPPDAYPAVVLAQLRAQAWKDRAHTMRYLGRYEEAFQAIDMAERVLANFPTTIYDRAIVALVKASTLQHVERFEESRVLLRHCRDVFRDHGDVRLYLYCGINEGLLLHRQRQFVEAYEQWSSLLAGATRIHDHDSLARLHNNLGLCAMELGRLADASQHLSRAKAIFTDLGRPVEATRSEYNFGVLLLNRGAVDRAVEILEAVRLAFRGHGLVEESGLCALAIARARITQHDAEGARALVREVIDDFSDAHLDHRAFDALNFLATEIAGRRATPEVVERVETFVRELRTSSSPWAAMPA